MSTASPPPLLADAMLGRLARWLRVLGLDVAYDARLDDHELVEKANIERRVLLTRDRRLVARRRAHPHLLIDSERLEEQLAQVIGELGIEVDPDRLFGRCLRCNEPLTDVPAQALHDAVPRHVAESHDRLRRCPRCGRIYWPATHVRRMRHQLTRMGLTE